MARVLMYGFFFGAAVALGSLSLLGGAAAGACLVAAGVLLIGYDDLPRWTFVLLVTVGVALGLVGVRYGGASYAILLALPLAYAAYFLRKVEAAVLVAVAAAGSVAVVGGGLVTASALVAVSGLVGLLRANVNRLIWRLSDAAVTDSLTGLLNRRGFRELFETELERARRSGQPLSLITGDLDHFKALNDRFGHAAGDQALEQIALILGTAKRRIDTAARLGGEEFAVVLPDSDHHAAYILAERMRREVRETFMYEPYELTISLGVATFPLHGGDADALVASSDDALYAAKALGRDRTVVWGDDVDSTVLADAGVVLPRRERHAATMRALAEVVDSRAGRGGGSHSQAVSRLAGAIARELGLAAPDVERVRFGGVVHDLGKIGVPDAVLRKPGWLSAEDWQEVRRHPEVGARILAGGGMGDVSAWVLAHHERPDGTGYPAGLAGSSIPVEARILAVADAYEAMTSDRVYRAALTPGQARAELVRCAGTQFDPRVVEAFLRVLDAAADGDRGLRLVR
jgi:diguanylate cyclase (GGDEF)-like protein